MEFDGEERVSVEESRNSSFGNDDESLDLQNRGGEMCFFRFGKKVDSIHFFLLLED